MSYSQQRVWYHATTERAIPYLAKGIDVEHNKGTELDFGYGFYLTSSLEEAKNFGLKLKKATERLQGSKEGERPVVVEYEIPLSIHEAQEKGYNVKIFETAEADFFDFVFHNRTKNIYGENQHEHDMIFGDMANENPILLIAAWQAKEIEDKDVKKRMGIFENFKQLSIHKQEICDKLKMIKTYDAETGEELP